MLRQNKFFSFFLELITDLGVSFSPRCKPPCVTLLHSNQRIQKDEEPRPTSGKFCRANALAMLWSSVQLMASAIASTPRQLAAVSCFSGVNVKQVRERKRDREIDKEKRIETKTRRKQKTDADWLRQRVGRGVEKQNTIQSSIKRLQTYKAAKTEKAAAGSTEP